MVIHKEPNPPNWPDSVKIFRENDDIEWIQKQLIESQDPYHNNNETLFTCEKHFSPERTVLLFAPGTYKNLSVEIGYYVQLAGLGRNADDVKFINWSPYVPALNKHLHKRKIIDETSGKEIEIPVGTCLDSFWRSAENFAVYNTDLQWAVSQAAPLRRVLVNDGDVYLHDGAAYASGGHFANSKINNGTMYGGGQQQFLFRNVHLSNGASGGAWSMVYVGCTGNVPNAATGTESNASITVVDKQSVRVEKPYIAMNNDNDNEKFELRIPKVMFPGQATYTQEPLLDGSHEEVRDFSRVRVVRASEPSNKIQEALDEGKDVVLSPGIYALEKTIEIKHPKQVLLGLGLATLEAPRDGSPCIHVHPGVPGVRIAGIMLEATEKINNNNKSVKYSSLFEWGENDKKDLGNANDPGAMFDIFIRVGGATAGKRDNISVNAMMRIHSSHVIGDNLWIWRADHAILGDNEDSNYPHISPIFWQSEQNEYRAETGIVVTGDDVTMYGLAVEHANGHQTIWSGERGSVHFYQCEFPYGVYQDFADKGFRGYLIEPHVEEHVVNAPGIYSNFRNDNVMVTTAIEHPEKPGIQVNNPFTVKLDNQGGILSIANGKGASAHNKGDPIYLIA